MNESWRRADNVCTHEGSCAGTVSIKGLKVYRIFHSERGSVASEISYGVMMVGILVVGGLWAIAQLEGVSFQVLLDQLRQGTHAH
ncbi:MAG: hypothetical protein QOJ31_1657 [Gaiellales bacterium]|nr:hypothetical protein [Gaiellales bacterium]